jgi:hypothetical protein
MRNLFNKYFELSFWIIALTSLALMQPDEDVHYSFCIFKLAGFTFCPGCGLGHSISYLFHGYIKTSFTTHPLGIFAVLLILLRIYTLLHILIFSKKYNQQLWNQIATQAE